MLKSTVSIIGAARTIGYRFCSGARPVTPRHSVISCGRFRAVLVALAAALVAYPLAAKEPASPSDPALVIPLQPYLRAQMTMQASMNGITGTFLFDTGEGLSTISPAYGQKVGCHPWGRVSGFRMSGERLDTPHCDDLNFVVAGKQLHAPAVIILDIMKFMGSDVPSLDGAVGLDIFAGKVITIIPRRAIVVESPGSLAKRIAHSFLLQIRIVRDVEGLALAVDAPVRTSSGLAWMELDDGNGGSMVIANHIAPLLGLATDVTEPIDAKLVLGNDIEVQGKARTRDLIMDGNIGAGFLNKWNLTLDLAGSRAWLSPATDAQ